MRDRGPPLRRPRRRPATRAPTHRRDRDGSGEVAETVARDDDRRAAGNGRGFTSSPLGERGRHDAVADVFVMIGILGVRRRHAAEHRSRPARVRRLPARLRHRRERRPDLPAFIGFSMITFAPPNATTQPRSVSRATNRALGFTTIVYALLYGPADRRGPPAIGDAGFTMITVAAMVGMADSVARRCTRRRGSPGAVRRRPVPWW